MEMHLVRVILGESKAKEVFKMRKENKNSSKDKVTVKASSKDKETVNNSKEKVAMLKANNKSSKKVICSKDKMVVRTTKAKRFMPNPHRDTPTFGRRIPSSRV